MRLPFTSGTIYHVVNKSIANFGIFNRYENSHRFINTLTYYNSSEPITQPFSKFIKNERDYNPNVLDVIHYGLVKFIAYCIMPDHYHLLIKILGDDKISKYINDVENSYTRFFNTKNERKGPLWQSAFKAARIKNNEQLLHVSRYIHLNPTTNNLVENPEDWTFSSYRDFVANEHVLKESLTEISIANPLQYKQFVEDQKDYQRKLKMIKKLLLE